MKQHHSTAKAVLAATLASFLVAGCFGGDDDGSPTVPAPTSAVPGSASQSASGFIDYVVALIASPADTLEPVDVAAVTPPADETSEPRAVN